MAELPDAAIQKMAEWQADCDGFSLDQLKGSEAEARLWHAERTLQEAARLLSVGTMQRMITDNLPALMDATRKQMADLEALAGGDVPMTNQSERSAE